VFSQLAHVSGSVLLETQSSSDTSNGRYSVICTNPFGVISVRGDTTILSTATACRTYESPFTALKDVLRHYDVAPSPEVVFCGGVVGYLGYELLRFVEDIRPSSPDDIDMSDCWLGLYDHAIVFDHEKHLTVLVRCDLGNSKDELNFLEKLLCRALVCRLAQEQYLPSVCGELTSSFTKEEYCRAVRQVKEYIASGDVYQVNLSQRFKVNTDADAWKTYLCLRNINPAPYAAYLNTGECIVVSSSPECFLVCNPIDRTVTTRPIKGTRPRGINSVQDRNLVRELVSNEKDRAENIMIVDLERNDLGKVCEFGSVKVPELLKIETYSTVHHLVSTVTGILREECDAVDLLKACFPGGSVTGAPKVRAMQVIDELEPVRRGVYTGSIGWIGFDGSINLNIAIRTAVFKDKTCYFHVGGGIVADSEPEIEYQETLDKGKAFFEVFR
jgi:para-aminobenzoate synthetase component 1